MGGGGFTIGTKKKSGSKQTYFPVADILSGTRKPKTINPTPQTPSPKPLYRLLNPQHSFGYSSHLPKKGRELLSGVFQNRVHLVSYAQKILLGFGFKVLDAGFGT